MALNSQRMSGSIAYFALLFIAGTVCRVEAHNEEQMAYAIPLTGITIDGKLDDWPGEMAVYPIEWESPSYYRPGPPDGPEDFSGSFRVGYNLEENLLYLAIVVRDEDVVVHPEQPDHYRQDLCEVYVDADHSGGDLSGDYSTTARRTQQYAMVAGASKILAGVDGNPALVGGDTGQSGVQGAFLPLAGYIVYEWAIPLFESFPDQRLEIRPGRTIGFDVALVDADGLESGDWFAWTPKALKVSNSSRMGDLTFVENYQGLEVVLGEVSLLDFGGLGSIVGRVEKRAKGESIEGARVELLRDGKVAFTAYTDSAGGFRQSVPEGMYALRGFSRGMRDTVLHEEVAVSGGEEVAVGLILEDLGTRFHVDDDALEGGDGSAGDPFRTISEALAATSEGDTVQVAAGVYREPVKLLSGVTLLGAGPDSTFLDGEGKRGVVQITSVKNVVLEGFAIVNGRGRDMMQPSMAGDNQPPFAGILIGDAGNVWVAHNLISGNINTHYSGGGILCYGADSTVVIAHNAIVGNSAQRGQWGGSGGGGGILFMDSRAVVRHNTVVFNRAAGEGGGILCEGASPHIHDNIVVHNINGGIAFKSVAYRSAEEVGPGPRLARNDVWNNTAYDYLGLEPGEGDFSVDPEFRKVETGDFRLAEDSPLRGAGSGGDVGAPADLLKQGRRGMKVVESVGQGLRRLRKKRSPPASPVVRRVEYLALQVPPPRAMQVDTIQVEVEPLEWTSPDRREKLYDRSTGLPSNQVSQVAPAPDGSVWVGTDRGAARYDGLWTYWDTLAGLPGNEVEQILPAHDGSIWIATRQGLAHLREGEVQTVSQESFSNMIEDTDRGIWVETYGQLAHLDSGWTYVAFSDSVGRPASPTPLFAAEEEGIWGLAEGNFGPSGESAVLRFRSPDDLEAYALPEGIETYRVQAIPTADGRLWIILPEQLQIENSFWSVMRSIGLFDPDAASLTVYRLPEEWQYQAYSSSILIDDADVLWIFGMHALPASREFASAILRFDGERWRGVKEVEFAEGRVALDGEGNFWSGHRNRGLTRYGVGTWTAYEGEERLEGKAVHCVVEDREGSLWFGGGKGLVRRDPDGSWSRAASIDTAVTDLLVDRQGRIWAGTMQGVQCYDGREWTRYAAREGVADTAVTALAEGADGRIWAGTAEGLFRFDGEGWESLSLSAWNPGGVWRSPNSITELHADSEGRMWIGTGGGLNVFDGERVVDYFEYFYPDGEVDLDAFFSPEEPEEIQVLLKDTLDEELDLAWFMARIAPDINFGIPDSNRQRVVGAYNQLLRKDADFRNLVRRTVEDGYVVQTMFSGYEIEAEPEWRALSMLGSEAVATIFADRTGNLWFANWGEGLFERRDGGWIYHEQSALPFDGSVRNALTDRGGNLWLATDQGAVRYDGEEWVTFRAADGLADNAVADIFEDRRGDIWFATGKGMTRYRPDRRVPQTRMVRGPEGTVGYGTTTLTFWFEGGDWEWEEEGMTFAHALLPVGEEPGGEDWSAWSEKSFVQVEPPGWGHFTFHVRARDKVLNVDPTPATHAFFIAAPWWRDGRFQAAAGLALFLILLSSSYGLRKQRQAREAERALIRELEEELQTAHELQMGLMPKEPPQIEGVDVAGRCVPFNHVGGDFFQYFPVGENRLAVSLADVTGHAMEAAVPVMMFSGILKTEMRDGKLLEKLFSNLNETLCDSLDERTFVCFAMGEFDASALTLKSSNCGCPYPYHYRAASRDIVELQIDAYPLGIRPGAEYRTLEVDLAPGDRIVFCSDGIIEAENVEGEMLGYERTAEVIRKGCEDDLGAAQLIDRIFAELGSFAGGTPPGDDQTVVVVAVER